jgi:hypothetical protein
MRLPPTTLVTLLILSTAAASPKIFDPSHMPNKVSVKDGDSFSVECKNASSGLASGPADLEEVDVDNATVTITFPGNAPVVHKITQFSMVQDRIEDRFGATNSDMHLQDVHWGGSSSRTGLTFSDGRWRSYHEDGSFWVCAN